MPLESKTKPLKSVKLTIYLKLLLREFEAFKILSESQLENSALPFHWTVLWQKTLKQFSIFQKVAREYQIALIDFEKYQNKFLHVKKLNISLRVIIILTKIGLYTGFYSKYHGEPATVDKKFYILINF